MSADNITDCPECEQYGLREWQGISVYKEDGSVTYGLHIDYRCKCYECGFEWEYKNRRIVPTKRIGAL